MEGIHRRTVQKIKDLEDPDNHAEPDNLQCEFKRALGSTAVNNTSESDVIPAELFKILKTDAIKVFHAIYQQFWKMQQCQQDKKKSILIPIPKKGSTKECSNHRVIALIFHASKIMFKILHARLQHYVNQEFPDVQAGFRKAEGPEIKLPTCVGS